MQYCAVTAGGGGCTGELLLTILPPEIQLLELLLLLLHLAGILDHRARPLGIAYEHTSVVPTRDFCAHRYEFAAWLSPAT